MSLYFQINLFSILVPFIVSFHPKVQLYKNWKALTLALVLSAVPFIIWDIIFTKEGYWGFNSNYIQGIYFYGLPLEELLFFICIPFASLFTHFVISKNTNITLSDKAVRWISYAIFLLFTSSVLLFYSKSYSLWNSIFGIFILCIVYFFKRDILNKYFLTFLVILFPFIIVNGILTGSGIEEQVVWYNNYENLSIRIFTIPIEDFFYAFSMILLNLFFFEKFKK